MMNVMRYVLTSSLFAAVLFISAACDPIYPIVLRNGLSTPITIGTVFNEGELSEGVLRPGEQLVYMHPKGEITNIRVSSQGRELYALDKKMLLDMRDSVADLSRVIWNIQSDGIIPLKQAELEKRKNVQ